jgi:ABC-type lipoprotein release transport system permease subunit
MPIVIVGAGHAAGQAAASLRQDKYEGDIVGLLLRTGTRELAWGLGFGLLLAFGISRAIASQMDQIPLAGAGTFAAIAALITSASLLALWRPALRALRLEPVEALRVD